MKRFASLTAGLALLGTLAVAEGVPGQHFVENWDLNGDGTVTQEEATERRGDVFLSFDGDEDGFLNAEEYDNFDEARRLDMENNGNEAGHKKGSMKSVQQGMTREFNDADKDGRVSRQEFLDAVPAWIAMIDKNGDGAISRDDFGKGN